MNWAEANGTAEELAMAKFMAFAEIPETQDNIYSNLVAGNAFWQSHRELPKTIQMAGITKLMLFYQQARRFEEVLPVTIRYCELRKEANSDDQCNELGKVYYDLGQYSMALKYYFQNTRNYAEQDNMIMTASSFNNVGLCFEGLNNLDSARWAYRKGMEAMQEYAGSHGYFDETYCDYFSNIIKWNLAELDEGFEPIRDMPLAVQHVINGAKRWDGPIGC